MVAARQLNNDLNMRHQEEQNSMMVDVHSLYPDLLEEFGELITKYTNTEHALNICEAPVLNNATSQQGLYPDLQQEFPEIFASEKLSSIDKINNMLHEKQDNGIYEEHMKGRNEMMKICNICAERQGNKQRRLHRRLKRGYKVLAFTVGLPLTLVYLAVRTSPRDVDQQKNQESEFDEMAKATAKLFRMNRKNNR